MTRLNTQNCLKRLSTGLVAVFFVQSSLRCLFEIDEHASFVAVATSANLVFVKLFLIFVSLTKLSSICLFVLPPFSELQTGKRLSCACLVVASFVELCLQTLSSDTSAATTSFFLLLTCSFQLLETMSSRNLRIYHGSLGEKSTSFDNFLDKIRNNASRYNASSTTTILIVCLFVYTFFTTDTLLWKSTSLKRQLSLSTWSKTASIISLLAAVGCADKNNLGNKKNF